MDENGEDTLGQTGDKQGSNIYKQFSLMNYGMSGQNSKN